MDQSNRKPSDILEGSENMDNARFGVPVSEHDIKAFQENQQSKNTGRNMRWAKNCFETGRQHRNKLSIDGRLIPDFLQLCTTNPADANHWLSCFILEARKLDGSAYPPGTLYNLSCGLLRYLRDSGCHDVNFLDEKDVRFVGFRKTLDAKMKELATEGVGVHIKQADPVTPRKEDKLWTSGTI